MFASISSQQTLLLMTASYAFCFWTVERVGLSMDVSLIQYLYIRHYAIKAKIVTSPDTEADPLPNVGRVAFSKKYQTARNPRSDMPKTSEYAFFKKLKKDVGHSNSDLLHRRSKLSKNSTSDTTSTHNVLKCPNKDLKIPIQVEKEYQTNECQSFSPVDGVIGISKEAKLKSFSLPTAVTPVDSNLRLSPLAGPSNNSGSQYSGNGIFAAKRQKLHQQANALFLDVEKLNSERFDLVSALLSRLFPGRKEGEDFWDSKVRKGENSSTTSLALAKPDHARPHSQHKEDVTVPEYRMSQTDGCLTNFFCRPTERVPLEWDNFNSAFHLIDYDAKTGLLCEDVDNSQISNNKSISLWDQSDSLPSLSFDRHGFADHFLPDRLHSADIPVSREAQNLFLDWDFNEEKSDPALAITTSGGNKLCSPIATLLHVDYQRSTEKKFDALALSSLYTNSAYFDALPYFHSNSSQQKLFPTKFCSRDFGTILEHEECAVARLDQFDLPLLCNSEDFNSLEDHNPDFGIILEHEECGVARFDRCDQPLSCYSEDLTSLEDCNPGNAFESGNVIVPYLSHLEKNHCDSDELLPITLDTFGWNFLSATSSQLQRGLSTYHTSRLPHREDTVGLTNEEIKYNLYDLNPRETAPQSFEQSFNCHIWYPCNSEVSCDKARGGSLLLENSSWVTSVEEISPDHSDEWTLS
ncbi:PREDICTED: uncharacterized protein LOC109215576 isoform X2 [Nicotiana attenuata]|uniref:uncharacterized protein LOC109215576 isoform X2 n=1 Tax=Nicotiana attenuata TaxID=49451 RepID=UPI000904CAF4|nr:PREDICTED: uncharacterized protein LOC109215576 isoform X2 [Nicotiana attenuata]